MRLATLVAEQEADEEPLVIGDEEEDTERTPPEQGRRRTRRRRTLALMRSRNSFIDAELRRGQGGGDSFADLEDFIVCPNGPIVW